MASWRVVAPSPMYSVRAMRALREGLRPVRSDEAGHVAPLGITGILQTFRAIATTFCAKYPSDPKRSSLSRLESL